LASLCPYSESGSTPCVGILWEVWAELRVGESVAIGLGFSSSEVDREKALVLANRENESLLPGI